jgi:HEAT repeats
LRQDGEGDAVARSLVRTLLSCAAASTLGLTGCAGTYDLVTSQRFKERPFHTLFTTEDPIEVLEKVQEGDDRVRAMRNLEEPREHGGSQVQQDRLIAILQSSATTESRPLCRLAAVEALSRFKDPRVGPILIAAYRNAPYDVPPTTAVPDPVSPVAALSGIGIKSAVSAFTPDTVTSLQCSVLESLGRHRDTEGLKLLVEVAATPTERPKTKPAEIEAASAMLSLEASAGPSEVDRMDVRLAAIRALGNYQNDATATRTLVAVLRVEKDVAVRGRAHESLTKITGKDLPPDGAAWADWMEKSDKR